MRTAEADQRRKEAEASRDEIRVLADQHAALRRVATLVARAVAPSEVFSAVARSWPRAWAYLTRRCAATSPMARPSCWRAHHEPAARRLPVGIAVLVRGRERRSDGASHRTRRPNGQPRECSRRDR